MAAWNSIYAEKEKKNSNELSGALSEEHLVAAASDEETARRVELERACVAAIGGGCLAPIAAHHDGTTLTALVADPDGRWVERRTGDDPVELASELAALAA